MFSNFEFETLKSKITFLKRQKFDKYNKLISFLLKLKKKRKIL